VRFSLHGDNSRQKDMSAWLIVLTGAVYAYIAAEQLYRGNPSMAVVYAGYAFSNVGLYLLAK
jgi:NhaP-type Na+/H+ or K+/H+ antiporter